MRAVMVTWVGVLAWAKVGLMVTVPTTGSAPSAVVAKASNESIMRFGMRVERLSEMYASSADGESGDDHEESEHHECAGWFRHGAHWSGDSYVIESERSAFRVTRNIQAGNSASERDLEQFVARLAGGNKV